MKNAKQIIISTCGWDLKISMAVLAKSVHTINNDLNKTGVQKSLQNKANPQSLTVARKTKAMENLNLNLLSSKAFISTIKTQLNLLSSFFPDIMIKMAILKNSLKHTHTHTRPEKTKIIRKPRQQQLTRENHLEILTLMGQQVNFLKSNLAVGVSTVLK